jgi:hypothetical protein
MGCNGWRDPGAASRSVCFRAGARVENYGAAVA